MVGMSNEHMAGRSYRVDTYGCQMNTHESEKIAGILEAMGLIEAPPEQEPDVLVLNTCCVRDSAEQRIIGHIGTLKKHKESNPRMLICVAGCLTQQEGMARKLTKTFPFLDVILGTHSLPQLGEALAQRVETGKRVILVSSESAQENETVMRRHPGPLAQTNIMYGCNNFCSYCIVPYVRGPERSREATSVLAEVRNLAKSGYREVTLLGQNVNSYADSAGTDFPQLLRMVARESGIERIRFMTSHPKDLTQDLIDVIASEPNVCNHVHLPAQSGSDDILRSMNRRYTSSSYMDIVRRLKEAIPGIAITTDLIVGYPGETDADFEQTLDLVRDVRFDAAFTFVYSPRQGTRAAALPDQISPEVKKARIMRLIEVQNEISHQINEAWVGREVRILVEGPSARGEGTMAGRTQESKMVNFPGETDLTGQFATVRIVQAKTNTLFGDLLEVK